MSLFLGSRWLHVEGRLLQAGWVLFARLLLVSTGRDFLDADKVQHAVPCTISCAADCPDGTACRDMCST